MAGFSNAQVTIRIYDGTGALWIDEHGCDDTMYRGISMDCRDTIADLGPQEGVHLVHVRVSDQAGPVAQAIAQFHIYPPAKTSPGVVGPWPQAAPYVLAFAWVADVAAAVLPITRSRSRIR